MSELRKKGAQASGGAELEQPPKGSVDDMEKHADATDEEQTSDDEAPEEVSTAAATALAGRRRKAELDARKAVPKRKRARASTKGNKAGQGAGDLDLGDHDGSTGLELPSDLLLKVKSGGLRRMEAERRELQGANEVAQAEAALKVAGKARRAPKVQDVPRSDNFRLVVLDEEENGGGSGGAGNKSHAAEKARNFLRERVQAQKRISHGLLKARQRLGPSPHF